MVRDEGGGQVMIGLLLLASTENALTEETR